MSDLPDLDQFERSYCDCRKCSLTCRYMPGMCAPGDVQKIARYLGEQPSAEWIAKHFEASEGSPVRVHGKAVYVPTIVPAQNETNGQCVFMTDDGRCSVHPVAPFGCSRINVCQDREGDNDERHRTALQHIALDDTYPQLWVSLTEVGAVAEPVDDRRGRFQRGLHRVEIADEPEED